MNRENNGNKSSSAAPSPSKPAPDKPKAADKQTEAEFLACQMNDATAAMSQTFNQLVGDLKQVLDPQALTREYPWISMASAAALGFVAASAVTPSREESLAERLKSLFPKGEPAESVPEMAGMASAAAEKQKPSGVWSLLGPVTDALKTALVSSISSAVTAKAHQPQQPQPPQPEPQPHFTGVYEAPRESYSYGTQAAPQAW